MNKHFDLELLRTFLAIVDNGSMTRAVMQLHKSQSTVSMQLKRLETQLDVVLFHRKASRLEITEQGKLLAANARRLITLNDQTIESFNQSRSNQIKIGCPDDYMHTALWPVLEYLQIHQNFKFTVITKNSGELRGLLDEGELDIAIVTRQSQSNEGVLLYQDQGMWVASSEQCFNQLPLSLVLFESTCKYHSQVVDYLQSNEIEFNILIQSANAHLLKRFVREKNAITVMSKQAVDSDFIQKKQIYDLPELPSVEIVLISSATNALLANVDLNELAKFVSQQNS
ncbi:LysR family transcriptional regulator [Marinicellulosiphila megalodicopiae]|uniref:LysR family transcriptional regulator n=1 Tax=Marinicellulosiphila megalodicopiae TaxID=2724896 RepID=UPI003BB11B09